MKAIRFIPIVLAGALFAACGSTQTPDAEREVGSPDSLRYILDGQDISYEAVKRLEALNGRLFYLLENSSLGPVAQVFTAKADLEAAQGVEAAGLCVSARTKTTVYDWTMYDTAHGYLEITKGTRLGDSSTLFQSDGGNWDNVISSLKAADCVYTYLYTGYNFTGSVWVNKGGNFSDLGGWKNIVSSIEVDP